MQLKTSQDPSSIANVGLHFPHLLPETELEANLFLGITLNGGLEGRVAKRKT